jgi:periplasmic protein CpxP/Spy
MKSRILVAAGVGLALTTAGLVWAGQQGVGPLGAGGHCRFGQKFARLHVEFMTDRALRAAEATPEQRQQVEAIVEKAFADHARFRQQHQSLKAEAVEILTADTIDRTRLEELRSRHLQIAQQGSRHFTAVLAEVADVLTPEQRQKLAEHLKRMGE